MSPREQSRTLAYGLGLLLALGSLGLLTPAGTAWLRPGPPNTGHDAVACAQCHVPAEGTARQQIQANLQHRLGRRTAAADFGSRAVRNEDCESCHARKDDVHPPYRFLEPRFAEARAALAPQTCISCHREHTGRRMTASPRLCMHCHPETNIEDDRAEPTHAELIADEAWESCLQCHDYHGNHVYEMTTRLLDAPTVEDVQRYLEGGPSPYGDVLKTPARTADVP